MLAACRRSQVCGPLEAGYPTPNYCIHTQYELEYMKLLVIYENASKLLLGLTYEPHALRQSCQSHQLSMNLAIDI
jgi:hypothetical protein